MECGDTWPGGRGLLVAAHDLCFWVHHVRSWPHILLIPGLLTLGLLLAALPCSAQQRVMVMGVSATGLADLERGRLHREIVEALVAAGRWGPVERTDTHIDEIEFLMGCAAVTPACLMEFAELVESELLVWSRAQIEETGDAIRLTVTIWDPWAEVAREQDTLQVPLVRGSDWLPVRLRGLWLDLPVVEIVSGQAAYVEIDGVAYGAAPVITDRLRPGRHRVALRYAHGLTSELSIDVPTQGYERVESGATASRRNRDGGGMSAGRATGLILWGTAAVGATVGAVMAADATRIESSLQDAATQREAYELADRGRRFTRIANALFIGAGVTFVGGTVSFVRN